MMNYGSGALFGVLAILVFFGAIIGIVAYILTALGLYKLAQKQGEPNAWLAWIPIAQFYIIGKIVGDVKLGTLTIPRMDLVLPIGAVVAGLISGVPVLGLVALAYYALFIYSLFLLFKKYVPDQAVLYTVLSFFGLFPIFIFIIREKEQITE